MKNAKKNIDENKNKFLNSLDDILYNIWFKLWFESLDRSLSSIILVTPEKERLNLVFLLQTVAKFTFWILITILMTPIGLSFYCIWFILFRKYFRNLSYNLSDNNSNSIDLNNNDSPSDRYEILSFNVCLLPDTIARMNNLHKSKNRAELIGEILSKPKKNGAADNNLFKNVNSKDNVKVVDYIDQNNDFDFICLQEVWSIDMGKRLTEILHKKYKYVLFDAGHNTFKTNKYIGFDSGLLIASKYPIIDVKFKQFMNKVGACSLTGKGVLTAKVLLGKTKKGKDMIGFISNVHLQSYQKLDSSIHYHQLNEIQNFVNNVKENNTNSNQEHVLFDVICGDFNIDNISPVDKISSNHEIFKIYNDPLSIKPGIDHELSIGTEMRLFSIYDKQASTPELFKKSLEDPRLRRWFLLDGDIEFAHSDMVHQKPEMDEDGLPKMLPNYGGKRRVDRILFSKNNNIDVIEYDFITNFTRLSDHIPISVKFKCNY